MTQTAEYIISLIRAVIQEQPAPPIPAGISVKELFAFARSHAVEALVFREIAPMLSGCDDPV